MKFGSVCSGIEAASVAWDSLGWKAAWLAEIEPFPSAVLKHHWSEVRNVGDMTILPDILRNSEVEAPDVFVGGTPCQSFSVAGLRKGLSDDRGNLTLTFVEIANAIDDIRRGAGRPESIIVWENVPGVLSSKDNAFGCFLAGLCGERNPLQPTGARWTNSGCVYGSQRTVAWRVLDAQFFGVAQRRRRVFVVASARAGFDPAEVLFEWEGLRRDIAPSREKRKDAAARAGSSAEISINSPIAIAENIIGRKPHNGGNGDGFTVGGSMYTLNATGVHGVYCGTQNDALRDIGNNISPTLRSGNNGGAVTPCVYQPKGMVRRLTPTECERLQGFPDGYTAIPWRGKPASDCPDGLRYKALGNSMAVPVMRWIGERIKKHA